MRMNLKSVFLVAALGVAGAASANTLPLDGSWQIWDFGGPGFSASPDWTFSGPAKVDFTDAFLSGDEFNLYDNGVLEVTGSAATTGEDNTDPDQTFTDPNFSHGTYNAGAGSHDITFDVIASPYGAGGAYIRGSAVTTPSPAAALPFLLGMAARRRKKA